MKNRSQSIAPTTNHKKQESTVNTRQNQSSTKPTSNMRSTMYRPPTRDAQKARPQGMTRPKKCLNCKKMISSQAYNDHLEGCHRFNPPKPASNSQVQKNTVEVPRHPVANPSAENKIKNQSYRIKKVQNNPTAVAQNNSTHLAGRNNEPVVNSSRPPTSRVIVHQPPVQPIIPSITDRVEQAVSDSEPEINNVEEIPQIREMIQEASQARLRVPQQPPRNMAPTPRVENPEELPRRRIATPSDSDSDSDSDDVPEPEPQPISPPRIPPREMIRPAPPQQQRPPVSTTLRSQGSLVINTDEITNMISRLSYLRENQTIQVMIEQLRHLNVIASQVNDIGMLGVGAEMGMIFANRVRELQSNLINQIGEIILRSLSNHLTMEAAIILSLNMPQEPPPPGGFKAQEIETRFPNKFNLSNEQASCAICLNDMKKYESMKVLTCKHEFHPTCVTEWLLMKTTCPVCRTQQKV